MSRKVKVMVLSSFIPVFIYLFTSVVWGNIPQEERGALIALYNSTNGDRWSFYNNNWKTPPLHTDGFALPGTENNWNGVTCDPENTTVTGIELGYENLVGTIPPELGNLSNLKGLYLSGNHLTGNIPPELGYLSTLESLSLSYNQLTGSIPRELGNLANLRTLYLSSNQLEGSIPPQLGNLEKLESLSLSSNQLEGPIPPELGHLANLRTLSLSSNQLEGSIPPELGSLSKLESLYLYSNQLEDSIPPQLGNLVNLSYIDLDSNQLTGSIPPQLENLANLQTLDLSSNHLTGGIPPQLENLVNLSYIDLDSNQLTGSIPPQLGNLANLGYLYLSSNQLSGGIPPQLSDLSELYSLDLSSNQLTGNIPAEMQTLSQLGDNGCDFRWNGLYTEDEALKNFLDSKQTGQIWDNTQTVAPKNVTARGASPTSVTVSWEPIAYSDDEGSYRVFYSRTPGGPYILGGFTQTKYDFSLDVSGLDHLIYYYFVVQTRTEPHGFNQNALVSNYSTEVSSGTQGSDIIISGKVSNNTGKGLEGVTLTFSPSNRFEITDANGNYRHAVKSGWSGTVTPAKTGYKFEPFKLEFENLLSDQPGKNFKADPIPLAIKGSVTSGGEGIPNVNLIFVSQEGDTQTAATDRQGNYNHAVPYGWTGRVTPSSGSIFFFPPYIDYVPPGVTNVLEHQDFQLSVSLTLNVSRQEDSTVIIKKEYGKIELLVRLTGISPTAVQSFVIYRKESDNTYEPIREFPVQEPYQFTCEDKYLDKSKSYTYIGKALDAEGKVIGESGEKTI